MLLSRSTLLVVAAVAAACLTLPVVEGSNKPTGGWQAAKPSSGRVSPPSSGSPGGSPPGSPAGSPGGSPPGSPGGSPLGSPAGSAASFDSIGNLPSGSGSGSSGGFPSFDSPRGGSAEMGASSGTLQAIGFRSSDVAIAKELGAKPELMNKLQGYIDFDTDKAFVETVTEAVAKAGGLDKLDKTLGEKAAGRVAEKVRTDPRFARQRLSGSLGASGGATSSGQLGRMGSSDLGVMGGSSGEVDSDPEWIEYEDGSMVRGRKTDTRVAQWKNSKANCYKLKPDGAAGWIKKTRTQHWINELKRATSDEARQKVLGDMLEEAMLNCVVFYDDLIETNNSGWLEGGLYPSPKLTEKLKKKVTKAQSPSKTTTTTTTSSSSSGDKP